MKSHTEYLPLELPERMAFENTTPRVEAVVAITKGELDFGPWEQVFYGEFDGRRRKRIFVGKVGE